MMSELENRKATILVVEDESAIREMLRFALGRADFHVLEAADAYQARDELARELPDIILLDWMLPGISGIEIAQRLRREKNTRDIPIIMLTARGEEEDKIRGLELGADDYVTKPFSTQELIARINAILRRAGNVRQEEMIEIGEISLDSASHRVIAAGRNLELGPTEFRLLKFFMTHSDRVFSRSHLLDQIWGNNVYIEERTVDVHIRRLRKALSSTGCDNYIQTVRGTGYRFSKQV